LSLSFSLLNLLLLQPMVTEATETNSEDTGDSEGAVSKAYARFKPVTGVYTHSAAARQDGEAETSGNGAERGRVFYGHDSYYVFFRLHQCLYERCAAASAWHTLLQQEKCCNSDHHQLHASLAILPAVSMLA
jgi:hypothetical protein